MNEQKKDVIDLTEVWKLLKTKKKVFFKIGRASCRERV